MTADNAEKLRQILLETVKTHEVRLGRRDEFGQRYTLVSRWNGKIEVRAFAVVGLSKKVLMSQD